MTCNLWVPQTINAFVISTEVSKSLLETEKQLRSLQFNVSRILRKRDLQNGSRGCLESHKYVASVLLEKHLQIAFVAEFDCDLVHWDVQLWNSLSQIISLDPEWDLISLGSTFKNGIEVLPGIFKTQHLSETHAYLLSAKGASKISKFEYTTRAYDQEITFQKLNSYVVRPSFFFQRHWQPSTAVNSPFDLHYFLNTIGLSNVSKQLRTLFEYRR